MLTAGQRIPIIHDGKVYPVKVEEVRPSPAGHLIDTNLQVEFTAFDDSKAMDEEEEVSGLISGHKAEAKEAEDDALDDDDQFVETEEMALYSTVTNIAKSSYLHLNVHLQSVLNVHFESVFNVHFGRRF